MRNHLATLALLAAISPQAAAQQYAWVRSPVNGHEYATTAPMAWQAAETAAVAVGAHLATVRSPAEQRWIEAQFGTGQNTWIGLTDAAVQGQFVWSSGEPASYRNWCPNEPNGNPGEDYVHLAAFAGQCFGGWNDAVGTRQYRGLIERDPVGYDWQLDAPVAWRGSTSGPLGAYDPVRGLAIVTGGDPLQFVTWEYDGRTWNSVMSFPPIGPLPASMCWDGARVILVSRGQMATWDGRVWSAIPNAPAPIPSSARLVYDAARDRVLAFGGSSGITPSDETWQWDRVAWTRLGPTNAPPGRIQHAMTFDSARGVVVLHGGLAGASGVLADTWEWNGNDWALRTPATLPPPRASHTLTYVDGTGLTVMFGGDDGAAHVFGDLWIWDGRDWTTAIGVTGSPAPRRLHAAVAFPGISGQEVVMIGGIDGPTPLQVTQVLRSSRAFASYRLRGEGCAGSTTPQLAFDGLPQLGGPFALRGTGLPTYQAAVLWFGFAGDFAGSPLPVDLAQLGMPGCAMWSSADVSLVGVTDASGRFRQGWTIPVDAGLIGAYFNNQLLVRDPGANAAGVVVTRGGEGAFGR